MFTRQFTTTTDEPENPSKTVIKHPSKKKDVDFPLNEASKAQDDLDLNVQKPKSDTDPLGEQLTYS